MGAMVLQEITWYGFLCKLLWLKNKLSYGIFFQFHSSKFHYFCSTRNAHDNL